MLISLIFFKLVWKVEGNGFMIKQFFLIIIKICN